MPTRPRGQAGRAIWSDPARSRITKAWSDVVARESCPRILRPAATDECPGQDARASSIGQLCFVANIRRGPVQPDRGPGANLLIAAKNERFRASQANTPQGAVLGCSY